MANWIQGAIKHKGSLTAAAKRAGKSIDEYCSQAKDERTKRRCSLRKTLMSFNKK